MSRPTSGPPPGPIPEVQAALERGGRELVGRTVVFEDACRRRPMLGTVSRVNVTNTWSLVRKAVAGHYIATLTVACDGDQYCVGADQVTEVKADAGVLEGER
jgi:hypothetical protein